MSDSKANCKRDARVAEIDEASSASFISGKRTRGDGLVDFELQNASLPSDSTAKAISPATLSASGGSTAAVAAEDNQYSSFCSDCSSNESYEIVKDSLRYVDLEAPSVETEISTCISKKFSRETSTSSEICADTAEMDWAAKNPPATARNHRIKSPAARTPSQTELDEFFTAAEKYERKRFAEKYNYDIAKDAPLEGRYQWVRLKP